MRKSRTGVAENGVRYRRRARYFISLPCMRAVSLGSCTVDGQYLLLEQDPDSGVSILSPAQAPEPSFGTVCFYANCIAYEHDTPTLTWSERRRKAIFRPAIGKSSERTDLERLEEMFGWVADGRLEGLGYSAAFVFRRPARYATFDLPYTQRFPSHEVVALYAMALRQMDPFSEFLNYYRVIENLEPKIQNRNANGKNLVRTLLPRISTHDFGYLPISVERNGDPSERYVNAFAVYRRRALRRIKEIQRVHPDVARYLYNTMRCGIAHGASGIKTLDFDADTYDVIRDLALMKMLARFAIDDSVPGGFRRSRADDGWRRARRQAHCFA